MKIFISWSGKQSLSVATAIRDWLPYIFNGIELFVSSEDIRKGKRWPLEVSKELDACNFGIVCLTPDNLEAPWLLFEAGALSKSLKEASVYTLLVGGLRPGDVEGPLSHFQHTLFEKDDFLKLVMAINEALGAGKQEDARLKKIFDKFWEDLNVAVSGAMKPDLKPEKKRSADDILRELLETTNYIARNLPTSRVPGLVAEVRRMVADSELWPQIHSRVKTISPFAGGYLSEAKGTFSDGTLDITFPAEQGDTLPLVENARNIKLLQKVLFEMGLGENCQIVFSISPPGPSSNRNAPKK